MLRMSIRCETHNAAVVPAGDEFHWMPVAVARDDGSRDQAFDLDGADLYCTYVPAPGEFPDHVFVASVSSTRERGESKYEGCHVDGMGHDIEV